MALFGAAKAPAVPKNDDGSVVTALTDSSGGTTDGTVQAVSGSGADAAINNNFAELTERLNDLIAHMNDGR